MGIFDKAKQALTDATDRFTYGVTEAEARETKEHGIASLVTWSSGMYEAFQPKLDRGDQQATEGIYQAAKRAETILRDPIIEFIHSSQTFGKVTSALGSAKTERGAANRERFGQFCDQRVQQLEGMSQAITKIVQVDSLDSAAQTIPLEGGYKNGVGMNDYSATKQYLDELAQLKVQLERTLVPLQDVEHLNAIIRPDDLLAVSSLYRTIQLDLKIWQAMAVEARTKDVRRYDSGTLYDLDTILYNDHGISGIVNEHERAFSRDGLSSHDRGIFYMFGTEFDSLDADMGDRVTEVKLKEGFSDPIGHCAVLGLTADELIGDTELEIRTRVKKAFYKRAPQCHPDRNPNNPNAATEFNAIREAYEVLADPDKRRRYLES